MRVLWSLSLMVFLGCSHNAFIGPDDAGGDASGPDGSLPDGALPDGASADGASPDGGNAKGQQGYTPGSRLKVRYYEGSDGSEQAIGFYDSQRKENCYFQMADDGVVRCLPSDGVQGITSGYYADSNCTQAGNLVYANCSPAYFTQNTASNTCLLNPVQKIAVFQAGTKLSSGAWTKSGNSCLSLGASYDTWSVGAQVPSSSFQDATTTVK